MKQLITFLILFTLLEVSAQSIYGEIPPVNLDDLKMEKYEKDAKAEAVVLYDYGESSFLQTDRGFKLQFKRTTRIKIINKSGLDYADGEILLYIGGKEKERVENIQGTTYNVENNSIIRTSFNEENKYTEKYNKNYDAVKFAMPNVKEGSIIEYSYTLTSIYFFNLQDWDFQWKIPVVHSEYQVSLIPFYTYKWILQGANKFDSKKSIKAPGIARVISGLKYKDKIHNYVMKDLPAFRDEKYITTKDDYIVKMDWQLDTRTDLYGSKTSLSSTWKKINEKLLKSDRVGKYLKKAKRNAPKMIDVEAIKSMSDSEKVEIVLNYVKNNFQWNSLHTYGSNKTYKELMKDKNGSSGNLNLLTVGLLNAVGIDAQPVLSSTKKHGRIFYEYAFLHFFNYSLIYATVDNEKVFLDACNPYLSNRIIPSKCYNGNGLLVAKGDVQWIPITTDIASEEHMHFDIDLKEGELFSTNTFNYTGFDAASMRKKISEDKITLEDDLMNQDGIDKESIELVNLENSEDTLCINFNYSKERMVNPGKYYFSPFFYESRLDNPLKEEIRNYPISFSYPYKETFTATVNIPEGYHLDYYLKDYQGVDNANFSIKYICTETEGKLHIEYSYYFKKATYQAIEYGRLKYYFDEIVKLSNEKVVLERD